MIRKYDQRGLFLLACRRGMQYVIAFVLAHDMASLHYSALFILFYI